MSFGEDMVATCAPSASSWRERLGHLSFSRSAHAKILGGSLIMLFGSVFVSLANFGYNIGVARLLGPAGFSHAAAAVTIGTTFQRPVVVLNETSLYLRHLAPLSCRQTIASMVRRRLSCSVL